MVRSVKDRRVKNEHGSSSLCNSFCIPVVPDVCLFGNFFSVDFKCEVLLFYKRLLCLQVLRFAQIMTFLLFRSICFTKAVHVVLNPSTLLKLNNSH